LNGSSATPVRLLSEKGELTFIVNRARWVGNLR
jgi:hypothetical protein